MKTYITKTGAKQFKPSLLALTEAISQENNTGFCLACGSDNSGIEPDARKVPCEVCGAPKVYGAEELLLMNLYHN